MEADFVQDETCLEAIQAQIPLRKQFDSLMRVANTETIFEIFRIDLSLSKL